MLFICPANNPSFATPTQTPDGFLTTITNFDPAFSYRVSSSAGAVSLSGSTLRVSGLAPGQWATAYVTTTRYAHRDGSGSVAGQALYAALTPYLTQLTSTANGFTFRVANYSSLFTWQVSTTAGSISIDGTGLVTLSGLGAGASATATVRTFRTGYVSGSATMPGQALLSARIPALGVMTRSVDGFSYPIVNFDSLWVWSAEPVVWGSIPVRGRVTITSGSVRVTGLAPGESGAIRVTASRAGYAPGTTVAIGAALATGIAPTFDPPTRTATGFTVKVTNFANTNGYGVRISTGMPGTASISAAGIVTVTGLAPGQASRVEVTVTRPGYTDAVGTATSAALLAGLLPTFSPAMATANGFTIQVANFNSTFTWSVTPVAAGSIPARGAATISPTGLITVTGLNPGELAYIKVTAARSDSVSREAVVGAGALQAALTPNFGAITRTADGYTVPILNYNPAWSWTVTRTAGMAVINGSGLLQVTGLTPLQSSTVTVSTTRWGYAPGSRAVVSQALIGAARTPTFGAVTRTVDGFVVPLTNADAAWSVRASATTGTARVLSGPARVEVSGLAPDTVATLTVNFDRTSYSTGTATIDGRSLAAGRTPQFLDTERRTDGFAVQIANFDPAWTWSAQPSMGSATVSDTGLITVTDLAPAIRSDVTVTATRDGYAPGSAVVSARSLGAALTPATTTPTSFEKSFVVSITNYDPLFRWSVTTSAGTVSMSSTGLITVTGLADGQQAQLQLRTERDGFVSGTASVTGRALNAARQPTFGAVIRGDRKITVPLTNRSLLFATTASASVGTATVSGTNVIVTGLAAGQSTVVTVNYARTGYLTGTKTVSGTALYAALTPSLGPAIKITNGLKWKITNYSSAYTWTALVSRGSASFVTSAGSRYVVVTGLSAGQGVTLLVGTKRAGYVNGYKTVVAYR